MAAPLRLAVRDVPAELETLHRDIGTLSTEVARWQRRTRAVRMTRHLMLGAAVARAVLPATVRKPAAPARTSGTAPYAGLARAAVGLLVLRRILAGA